MSDNPFTLTFGKKPLNFINRYKDEEKIITNFNTSPSNEQIYIFTGIRGAGKTVTMTSLCKEFRGDDNWIIVDLNSEKDLLEGFASELYQNSKMKMWFNAKEFSFSFKGLTFSLDGETPQLTVETLIKTMISKIEKKNKKILITIDEVVSNNYMKIFAKEFQSWIRLDYPVFLLMTGLYENISKLQNDKALTFLYRAPKINLGPLNLSSIASSYKSIFNISENEAIKYANLTCGYAYAYQLLGYLLYENNGVLDDRTIAEYDQYLQEYVYEKLWSELSEGEQKILRFINNGTTKTKDLIKNLKVNNSYFSTYRDKLIKKGILISPSYGNLSFALPRFYNFVKIKTNYFL